MVAEVQRDQGGWLDLLVRSCTVVEEKPGHKILPSPVGERLRRKRHTVEKGRPERMLWSDESARAALLAKGAREP